MDNVTIIEITPFENTIIQVTPFENFVVVVPGDEEELLGIFDETFDETFE